MNHCRQLLRPPSGVPAVMLLGLLALALTACGGSTGQGLRVESTPLVVTSTSVPPLISGQRIEHVIPLSGGCGGPYLLNVVEGRMPDGLILDDDLHAIRGLVLEDGDFTFTVEIVDTGCDPFSATSATFTMDVQVGQVAIVEALLDGVPSLLPPGATPENPDRAALPTVIYNDFNTIHLVVAGGVGPYHVDVVDDPSTPEAGPLPLGTSIAPNSTTILGAPVEVGPEGGPFVIVLEATDAVGGKGRLAVQWKVDTPAIIIATDALQSGACGEPYLETLLVAGGVPPFRHEFVAVGLPADYTRVKFPDEGDVVFHPTGPPTVTPAEALAKIDATAYPPEDELGPGYGTTHAGAPPEGLRLGEATGLLQGVPRRRGSFLVHYHVRSDLVPNAFGQHDWRTFSLACVEAAPVEQDPRYTVDGTFSASAPYTKIAPAEQGVPYNPDSTIEPLAGLQLQAEGGVAKDGYTDAPHESQAQAIEGTGPTEETAGRYDWTVELDPDGDGGNDPIPGMELVSHLGIWRTPDEDLLVPQLAQEIAFTVYDEQLPTQLRHTARETVSFEVGPDTVIFTESTTSYSGTGSSNLLMNDTNMTVRALIPYTNGTQIRDLRAEDMPGTGAARHVLPSTAGATTTLGTMLSSIDLLRVSVNPTGWWDDLHGLNPRAARALQHGDRNAYLNYYGSNFNGSTGTSSTSSGAQPSATCVHIPACTAATVAHDPAGGVYTDGGQLYAFDSNGYFGVFILRKDSRVYVPTAFAKGTYTNFGDNWNQAWKSTGAHSLVNLPQMTVSPDGRFAALKLKASTSRLESAGTSRIVVFSLTGERPTAWGGNTYRIVGSGSTGSSTTGQYLFASSLTLTNRYLYYLIGSGSTTHLHWKDHYIYRHELLGSDGDGALLHPNHSADWTNSAGSPMQTPFQRYYDDFADSTDRADTAMVVRHGHNCTEVSLAPHPFRVSANGDACAILASRAPSSTSSSVDVRTHHVWVDFDGSLHQLSTAKRHAPQGGGRGTALSDGPEMYPTLDWGSRSGPTTGFEISDDGLRVAVVVNRDTVVNPTKSYSSTPDWTAREDVIAFQATNGTSWAGGATEIQVTGNEFSPSSAIFSSSTRWRFGALTFTRDGAGLVFWGGFPAYSPNSFSYDLTYGRYKAKSVVGSLYSYDFTDGDVRGILAASAGGHSDGADTLYSTSNRVAVTNSTWTTTGGVIKPVGGFISPNGNFRYIVTSGAVNSSVRNEHQLIGVNIRSLDSTQSINGHADGMGFLVSGMPANRGFLPKYSSSTSSYSYAYYGIGSTRYSTSTPSYYGAYGPGGTAGGGLQVVSENGGRVFFAAHYQRGSANTITSLSTSYQYGGPIHRTTHYDRGYYSGQVFVFDANVGGRIHQLTTTQLGSTSTSYLRPVTYLEVARDGRALALVYGDGGSVAYYREKLAYLGGIELDPATGNLLSGGFFQRLADASSGRVGSAMAFGPSDSKLYYARGTSNENNKILYADDFDATGTSTRTTMTANTRNYNVLHAGR